MRDRSELPATARKIGMIAPEEIAEALTMAAKGSYAIEEEELIGKAGKMFGFSRVTKEMREVISGVMNSLFAQSVLKREGDWLKA